MIVFIVYSFECIFVFCLVFEECIFVFDGVIGIVMQDFNFGFEDFGGEDFDGCNENLCLMCFDVVEGVYWFYFEVGVDIVEMNIFGGILLVFVEYDL